MAGQSPIDVANTLQGELLKDSVLEAIMPSVGRLGGIDRDFIRALWKDRGEILIHGWPGEIVLGGTETGLGILPPVGSLSVRPVFDGESYELNWHSKSPYDLVYVCELGSQGGQAAPDEVQNRHVQFVSPNRSGAQLYYVVGYREDLPTNASYVIVKGTEQIDSFFHPFSNGIATNWTGWASTGKPADAFYERRFSEEWKAPELSVGENLANRSAQVLTSEQAELEYGLHRFFIAQTQGRTYRPALRCQILEEVNGLGGEWAFEVMTGAVDPERAYEMDNATRVVTTDAWTELETNGEQISKWRFDHKMARTDEWVMNQTGAQDSDIPQKDIVLGETKTAVFFCVRLTGHKPNGIAIDGVRLVDVTDGFADAKVRETAL